MVRIDKSELSSLRHASTATIIEAAKEIVETATLESTIFDEEAQAKIPCFQLEELVLGHVLGRGGFCAVRELTSIKMPQSEDMPRQSSFKKLFCCRHKTLNPAALLGDGNEDNQDADSVTEATSEVGGVVPRESLARYVSRSTKKNGSSKYVVKQVNPELLQHDKVAYLKGIVDIELEAKYMCSLNHPNILRIRGLASPPPSGETFLILDRLKETLAKKLQDWLRRHRQCSGITGAIVGTKAKKENLLVERLVAAHNIADALDYLHSRQIIFRDCKPDNIGFCNHGSLKVFDFGLAREVKESDRFRDTNRYNLTGFTGAIRYMAPEVGLRKPYNFKADVYSWAQLMWYILELEPPLGVYTPEMFKERVFKRGTRPAVMDWWPEGMSALMKRCWSAKVSERPNFSEIKDKLGVVLLPFNSKKLLPNRFGEPAVPGQKEATKTEAPASTSSETTAADSCTKPAAITTADDFMADDCCDGHNHGESQPQNFTHC